MTISTTTNKQNYTGNGVTTPFGFPIPFIAASDLQVYVAGVLKTLTTDYTISGSAPYPTGANVTFLVAPANGAAVLIIRTRPYTQTLDLVANDPLPADSVEQLLGDHMVMLIQQLKEITDRSFALAVTDTSGASTAIPTPAANAILGWNSSATALQNNTGLASVVISAAMTPVVQAATLAAGRTAMGVAASGANTDITSLSAPALGAATATTAVASDASTKVATTLAVQNAIAAYTRGFLNLIRNGAMDIWQRGTSGTITAGSPAYTADGHIISSTGANVPWAQVAGRYQTLFALKVTGAASVTDVLWKQRIESFDAAKLYPGATTQVTIQAKIYNNTGGSITPTLTIKHANATDNFGAMTTDVSAVNLQACPNATLTTVAYTFASVAGTPNGLEATIDFGNNFSTNGKSVEISEIDIRPTPGLTTGQLATPPAPELRPISIELPLNMRHYYQINNTGSGAADRLALMYAGSATSIQGGMSLPVPMRSTNPTFTFSALNCEVAAFGTTVAVTSLGLWLPATPYSANIDINPNTAGGLTAGNPYWLSLASTGGKIEITAEL